MCEILLIRHADCEGGGLINGRRPDVTLTTEGLKKAEALAQMLHLYNISAIYSSPTLRSFVTAGIIARYKGLNVIPEESFNEIEYGKWTGMTIEKLKEDNVWKNYNTFRSFTRIPGGESIHEVQQRMISGIGKIFLSHREETVAVISHSDPIKAAIVYFLGIPIDLMLRLQISTASVTAFRIEDYGVELLYMNRIPN